MAYKVFMDGKEKYSFSSAEQCVAEILVHGWIDGIHKCGMVFAKGVEIHSDEASPPLRPIDQINGTTIR